MKQAPAILNLRAGRGGLGQYRTGDGRYSLERDWEKQDGTPRRTMFAPWRIIALGTESVEPIYRAGLIGKRFRAMREAAEALAEAAYYERTDYRVEVRMRTTGDTVAEIWPDDRSMAAAKRIVLNVHVGNTEHDPSEFYAQIVRVVTPMIRPDQQKRVNDLCAQTYYSGEDGTRAAAFAKIEGYSDERPLTEAVAEQVIEALVRLRDEC